MKSARWSARRATEQVTGTVSSARLITPSRQVSASVHARSGTSLKLTDAHSARSHAKRALRIGSTASPASGTGSICQCVNASQDTSIME